MLKQTMKRRSLTVFLFALTSLGLGAQDLKLDEVTFRDFRDGFKNTSRWLTYSGDYSSRRHSPLKEITPENVSGLAVQWTFEATGMSRGRGFEATPLLVDGVLFITGTNNWAWAIDARTGQADLAVQTTAADRADVWRWKHCEPRLWNARQQPLHGNAGRSPDCSR